MAQKLASPSAADPRAVRTSEAINAAFLSLLQDKPFDQITIREIVDLAEVHRATFFRYHESKEDLLNYVAARQIRDIVDLTLPILDNRGALPSTRAFCAYVDQHRDLWRVLLTGGAAPAMRDEWLRLARVIAADRPSQSWLPESLSVRCTVGFIAEAMIWWLSEAPANVGVDEMARTVQEMVSAFSAPPESKPKIEEESAEKSPPPARKHNHV
jgi:AcrR family transcriptional regulator